MWVQVDVGNVNWTSPSQVDDDLLELHWVRGFAGWYRVLDALADVDYQTTVLVESCAITVHTHSIKARDLLGCVLTVRRFLFQHHVFSAAPKDVCKLVEFCNKGITIPL